MTLNRLTVKRHARLLCFAMPSENEPPQRFSYFSNYEPVYAQQLQRLHEVMVYARWVVVVLLWLVLAPICLWSLRSEIALWRQYFTWTAVRYSFAYNPLPAMGLATCIGTTVAVLLWQSRNIVWGISDRHIKRLEQQLLKIRQQGSTHPLWKWVCEPRD